MSRAPFPNLVGLSSDWTNFRCKRVPLDRSTMISFAAGLRDGVAASDETLAKIEQAARETMRLKPQSDRHYRRAKELIAAIAHRREQVAAQSESGVAR